MRNYKKIVSLLLFLPLVFAACNKDNLDARKAMHVVVNGYNGSENALLITIDTTAYKGNRVLTPVSKFEMSAVYAYPGNLAQKIVTVTDTVSKKVIFTKPLPDNGTKAAINFLYIHDKVMEITPPPADTATNKLGFYIHYSDNETPVDIFLYRLDNTSGQEYKVYLAKNVKPGSWIYTNYLAGNDFGDKNLLDDGSSLCFTKAGTTDQWAFEDNENKSRISVKGMGLPLAGEKGFVQPYFITPGIFQLDYARMFFHPDRVR
ncbi:hypothetical protein [Chitinophaga arvensicola]|uniref:DUF1735 domain-containing protein n=1 Tax=Chitinophaga arvensicola TaxID=29529 RepID=A0A1I0R3V4_9BACT|nr:hypothetical protein [Chitinophaga arvensicola]SEW34947.1 hypothetical protein SAMN04488122_2166 [Chitinophaga arvensicola]